MASVPFGLLITAWTLTPDADGLGTHQQLGLPPCTVRVLWNVRCPACGMTTSWAHFVRGQLWESAQANMGGFALAWIATATGCGLACLAITGRRHPTWAVPAVAMSLVAVILISAIDWLLRL